MDVYIHAGENGKLSRGKNVKFEQRRLARGVIIECYTFYDYNGSEFCVEYFRDGTGVDPDPPTWAEEPERSVVDFEVARDRRIYGNT